nr:MAG: RNA-dependent RNA-polymerase [Picobirnavirus sp.]
MKTNNTNYTVEMVEYDRIAEAKTRKLSVAARRKMCDAAGAKIIDYAWTSTTEQIVNSRSTNGEPARYPLFLVGMTPQGVLNAVLPAPENLSHMVREVDLSKIDTIGRQGIAFSADYMLPYYLRYYNPGDRAQYKEFVYTSLTYSQQRAVRIIKNRLNNSLVDGKLHPLTWEEAHALVCGKDTAAWPTGGSKQDPATREWSLRNRDYSEASTLGGQRYQRNKHESDGSPKPRAIFNPDIRAVIAAARYEAPLTKFLQQVTRDQTLNGLSFDELNGPEAVGETICKWANSNPNMTFDSIEADVKAMDQHFTLEHAKLVYNIIADLFDDTDGLWESIEFSFLSPLVISKDIVLSGPHALFSGVTWVHDLEEILSAVMQLDMIMDLYWVTRSDKTGEITTVSASNAWKTALTLVCGDDTATAIAHPVNATPCTYYDSNVVEVDIKEYVTSKYAEWGMPTAPKKIAVRRNYINFCSKTYSAKAVKLDSLSGDPVAWRPVYSVVSAIANVMFPEYELHDPSFQAELYRVGSIVDQCYGHPQFNQLCTVLNNSLSNKDRELLRDAVQSITTDSDYFRDIAYRSDSWRIKNCEWDYTHSPFLSFIAGQNRLFNLVSGPRAAVSAAVREFYRSAWVLRMPLPDIAKLMRENLLNFSNDVSADDRREVEEFAIILQTLTTLDRNDIGLIEPVAMDSLVQHCCNPAGVRDIQQYDYVQTYFDNARSNTPLTDRIGAKPEALQSNGYLAKISGPKAKVRSNSWE